MGERRCEFEDCDALEFRTSGYCLRHKDGRAEITPLRMKPEAHANSGDPQAFFELISKLLRITIVLFVFASIFFPIQAFVFATNLANILAGSSNGDEPIMMSPIFCIIPVLFAYLTALVIGKLLGKKAR